MTKKTTRGTGHKGTGVEERCDICGRPASMLEYLIPGPVGNLCNECATSVHLAVEEVKNKQKNFDQFALPSLEELPKPKEIVDYLNRYVIGQDEAKRTIAVAVYNHYKRLIYHSELKRDGSKDSSNIELDKSNIIMVGPTGTGKTLLARSIARMLKVPFTIVDATVFTQAGYVGEDVESILSRLYQAANYDVEATERGIVFVDELDKLSRKQDNPSITRDVGGEGVQQGLLKLLEGADVRIAPEGGRKHPDQPLVKINTENILFIAGGAFDGIEKKIAKRLNTRMVGYTSDIRGKNVESGYDLLKYTSPADLRDFGLIPELIGRLPVLTYLQPLDREALRAILTEPQNAISKQYKKLLAMDGVDLRIDDAVYDFVVDKAIEYKVGARGLRSIFEDIMRDAMYELPSNEDRRAIRITRNYAEKHLRQTTLDQISA